MNIKELSINDGIPILGETWGGRGGIGVIIEGDIPIIRTPGATEYGGIKFGDDGWHSPTWPSGGGGRNIDPTDTIKFGNQHYDGIKFGGIGVIAWPTGGGGRNIEADGEGGIKFGGTGEGIWPPGIDWPPGDTIPGLPIQTVGGTGS